MSERPLHPPRWHADGCYICTYCGSRRAHWIREDAPQHHNRDCPYGQMLATPTESRPTMPPDLLTLSRAVAVLPGAPEPGRAVLPCDTADNSGYRDGTGIRWVWDDERSDFRLVDLTDAATGGVMLAALQFPVKVVTRIEPHAVRLMWLEEDGEGLGPRQHSTPWCDSFGEAVARVVVARGRWA